MPRSASVPVPYSSRLAIRQLRLSVTLGYEKEERKTRQAVDVDIMLYFPEPPEASQKDHGDFTCYGKISALVTEYCAGKEFRLIEYLCMEIYRQVRTITPEKAKLSIRVTKLTLPISNILGGASFRYSDLPSSAWVAPG